MSWEIRAATVADADGITDVQVAAWRAGYAQVFDESVLFAPDFDSSRRTFWNRWRFAPGHRVAVAVDPADRVLAFASYGPERERARGFTGRGEVWAFYAHPDHWGSGVASALMDHVEVRLQAEGFDSVVLWVLDDNPRGRRFYEKHGWATSGLAADLADYGDVVVPEVEYRKELT